MHLKFITNIRKKNILQEKIEKLFKAKEDIDFDIWIKFLRDNAESTFATIIDTKTTNQAYTIVLFLPFIIFYHIINCFIINFVCV